MAPVINTVPPLVQKQEITTVFVGNITDKASDTLIRQILMKCGYIVSWKRVQGASGRLQAFGFCEYADPEAGLRALRLLSGYKVGDKTLLVKVDSKTRSQLDRYKEQKKIEKEVLLGTGALDDYDIEKDDETKQLDTTAHQDIKKLLQNHMSELDSGILQTFKKTHSGNADNLEGLDMNEDTKDLVAKEIRGFRETYKDERKEREKEKEKERDRERERSRDRERHRERSKDREYEREKERQRERDRERERERERERRHRERVEREDRERRHREGSAPDAGRRGTPSRSRRSRSRSFEREAASGGGDEDHESKRLARLKKDKDVSYMEKLKEWEARERKKARDYEKQVTKEERKKQEEDEERTHLLEFLEEYDDEKDDIKYYKGSALSRRMRDRELEIQADGRDKQREMEEIEEVLRKQMSGETIDLTKKSDEKENLTPDIMENEKEEPALPSTHLRPAFSSVDSAGSSPPQHQISPVAVDSPIAKQSPLFLNNTSSLKKDFSDDQSDAPSKKIGFGMKLSSNMSNKSKLGGIFDPNEDEANTQEEPKKKLSRLDDEEGKKDTPKVEDKRKLIKNLVDKIPTAKEKLFAYPLKWDIVDQVLVEKRIKPWVNKKIFEYIGEEEQTLVEFICSKVLSKSNAKSIHEDVAMVLDDESEVFVVKMWRLLIYETEAKCLGLVK